jgi:hypothetical protein
MRIISRDVSIAVISTIIGVAVGSIIGYIVGYGISNHFYQISKQESKKDLKEELLQSALVDIIHNTLKENFPELHDSLGYLKTGIPRRKLVTTGIDRLYFNILIFRDYNKFEEFVKIVNRVKLVTDDFNERMTLYNLCTVIGPVLKVPDLPSALNPGAYNYYQRTVLPAILNLENYLKLNHQNLIQ